MKNNVLKESSYSVNKAVEYLKNGKLIALKTETVYGAACDPSNPSAIKKLYFLKKRPHHNPLIVHVNSLEMAEKIVIFSDEAKKIANHFWPGPLTLILPKKNNDLINGLVVSGLKTMAVRMPNSSIFQKILKKFNKPIAAPSANKSGYISSTSALHVLDSFGKEIDLIIDSGKSKIGLESTILDLSCNPYALRRLGALSEENIKNKLNLIVKDKSSVKSGKKPKSPGQLYKHYAPSTPLKMNISNPQIGDAYLIFGNVNKVNFQPQLNLSEKGDLNEAAHNLYDHMRKLDKLAMKRIVVSPIPNYGIGKTINERLTRAQNG